MDTTEIAVIIGGVFLIAFVLYYFFGEQIKTSFKKNKNQRSKKSGNQDQDNQLSSAHYSAKISLSLSGSNGYYI